MLNSNTIQMIILLKFVYHFISISSLKVCTSVLCKCFYLFVDLTFLIKRFLSRMLLKKVHYVIKGLFAKHGTYSILTKISKFAKLMLTLKTPFLRLRTRIVLITVGAAHCDHR